MISPYNLKEIFKLVLIYVVFQSFIILFVKLDTFISSEKQVEDSFVHNIYTVLTLSFALAIVWLWCVYIQMKKFLKKNKKILYAEILDINENKDSITRMKSK